MIVIGLMSGTAADGTTAAAVRIEGAPPALAWELLAYDTVPHPPALRDAIFAGFRPETGTVDRLCALNFALGRAFAAAANHIMAVARLAPGQVELIGSHGQTVWHIPVGPDASTLQLGEAGVIAELTGIPVVSNFRTRDMAAGGQGAPLVAYVDRLLFAHSTLTRALQNIGGIANVTYLPPLPSQEIPSPVRPSQEVPFPPLPTRRLGEGGQGGEVAFDTGPGNMLIDDAATRATEGAWAYDHGGALAAQGYVDERLLAELLAEPYLHLLPPKTTGRELFGTQFGASVWERATAAGLAPVDIVATLTAFTARSIGNAYRDFLPRLPDEVIVSGGGAQNPTLMAFLRQAVAPARVFTSADFGLPVEAKEAVAFAVLAYETWHNRPGNLPAATGAHRPVILGNITPGRPVQRPPVVFDHGSTPITEARNPSTEAIDTLPTLDMVRLINAEDARVAEAVARELPAIAQAIDAIAERMQAGGRLIYVGAGTSGRLAVLDASECPPTFGTAPEQVIGINAGGLHALTHAVEGAEDDRNAGARDLAAQEVTARDCVVGVAASGRTPYTLGALTEARQRGALTVSLACVHPSPMAEAVEIAIAPLVGPEVIAGSTRLKAGTAQKMVLNMLSTGVMIRLGKTYGNLMVDVRATNSKLQARAQRIVAEACDISIEEAGALLQACDGRVKVAIVVHRAGISAEAARARLAAAGGVVREALRI